MLDSTLVVCPDELTNGSSAPRYTYLDAVP